MLQEQATTRAQSHDWVVSVPMPVRLQIGEDGSVTAIVPAGLPALDQVAAPTCRRCGATTIELTCEEVQAKAPPTTLPHPFLPDFDHPLPPKVCAVCGSPDVTWVGGWLCPTHRAKFDAWLTSEAR